jgi:F0F1-type ATP synthase membrane subunit c/vacuolar-type H+-ATPase subunit K
LETRYYYEISYSSCYGRYFGYLWYDCGCITLIKRFIIIKIILVKTPLEYSYKSGFAHMASGLCCGASCIAAGFAIGIVGDVGVRGNA